MEINAREKCWSCGRPGEVIPGKSWLRRCSGCEVEWDAQPPTPQILHDRAFKRGRDLDKVAANYGLGNREGFMEHAAGELSSPA